MSITDINLTDFIEKFISRYYSPLDRLYIAEPLFATYNDEVKITAIREPIFIDTVIARVGSSSIIELSSFKRKLYLIYGKKPTTAFNEEHRFDGRTVYSADVADVFHVEKSDESYFTSKSFVRFNLAKVSFGNAAGSYLIKLSEI